MLTPTHQVIQRANDRRSNRRHRFGRPCTRTKFAYDEAGHLIGEYSATGTLVQETIWLGDIPVATLRPKTGGYDIFYVHTDHLNTPRRVTRPSDNKLRWRWDPTPFGEGAPNENPQALGVFKYNLRFPGQYFDIETNLAYNYFRDYDSAIGRYVESDPIGLAGGVNTYAYVLGNPIGLTDPTGLQASDLRTPSAAQIREMSQRSCARQAFLRNYEAMRAANWKRSDKYFHCKANCEAARCGPAGYDEACVVSNVREATDKAFGDPPSASAADQAANQYGRDVAAKSASITCQVGCSRYRPPGLPAQY
ncbi:MAG: RHS repeat-associated core domain-containing protein [Steroidobacteraceae bacterium]